MIAKAACLTRHGHKAGAETAGGGDAKLPTRGMGAEWMAQFQVFPFVALSSLSGLSPLRSGRSGVRTNERLGKCDP